MKTARLKKKKKGPTDVTSGSPTPVSARAAPVLGSGCGAEDGSTRGLSRSAPRNSPRTRTADGPGPRLRPPEGKTHGGDARLAWPRGQQTGRVRATQPRPQTLPRRGSCVAQPLPLRLFAHLCANCCYTSALVPLQGTSARARVRAVRRVVSDQFDLAAFCEEEEEL